MVIIYLYAFDLGMSSPGMTIFDLKTHEPIMITSIKTNDKETHGQRLFAIKMHFAKSIKKYPPSEIAIERGFSQHNTSTQVTFRVHGVVNEMFKSIPQFYYPPTTVKKSILTGNATKEAIRKEIEKKYPDIKFKNEDESDSFAVGLCHLIKKHEMKWEKV